MKLSIKYSVKIPENIKVLYIPNKNVVILISSSNQKSLKLKLQLKIDSIKNIIYVTNIPTDRTLIKQTKLLKSLQGTVTALLKQSLLELSVILNKKLELVGVGYKVFSSETSNKNTLLHFRLGFSHSLFFKISSKTSIFSYKYTNLYIFSNSWSDINQLASKIKAYKKPEPYKGKGILYKNEKIKLKEGKKI